MQKPILYTVKYLVEKKLKNREDWNLKFKFFETYEQAEKFKLKIDTESTTVASKIFAEYK